MIIQDSFDIQIIIGGKVLTIDPSTFSLSISTSIWNTYSKAFLILDDYSGVLQEYFSLITGTEIDIIINRIDDNNKILFKGIISKEDLPDVESSDNLGGTIQLELIHRLAKYQEPLSEAYDDTISNIVKQKVSTHKFKALKVDDTQPKLVWYQPLQTDVEFIEEMLLPRVTSQGSSNTPFFSFINCKDEYNFIHYKTMSQENDIKEPLFYKVQEGTFESSVSPYRISSIARRRKSFNENTDFSKLENYYIKMDDGSLEIVASSLKDFGIGSGNIPWKKDDRTLTNWKFYDKDDEIDENKGKLIYASRESLFQDEFVVNIPFNENVSIGKSIGVKFFTYNTTDDTMATETSQFSGNYIIEDLEHIWDGKLQSLGTKLVIGRKYVKLGSNYLLKGELD